jgi:outer membrane immunogenic protein
MRWVLSSLMVLALAAPALSAVQCNNQLIIQVFSWPYPNALASALTGPGSIIRRLLLVFGLMSGLLSPAFAADYDLPVLRGSQPMAPATIAPVYPVGPATYTRWSGFYVGGDFSYNNTTVDFSNSTQSLVGFALRGSAVEQSFRPSQTQVLGRGTDSAFGFGGFLGYNTQWEDLILGVEANYTHTSLNVTPPSFPVGHSTLTAAQLTPPLTIAPGTVTGYSLKANGHLDLTDYGEVRGRAGYIVGNLLPYGFVGFVVGRAEYSVSATTDTTCITQANTLNQAECAGFPATAGAGQNNALLWGFSVGAGLDWALTQNVFLRGEFEFIQFAPITDISVPVVNGRLGVGYKF